MGLQWASHSAEAKACVEGRQEGSEGAVGWELWAQQWEQRKQGEGALEGAAERAKARVQPCPKGGGKLRGSRQKSEPFPCHRNSMVC